MKTQLLALVAVLTTLSGCFIDSGPGVGSRTGDVTFAWTFAQKSCAQTPAVATVTLNIPGEVLQDVGAGAGVYNCVGGTFDGIGLSSFVGGDYTFTATARDNAGVALFAASGSFHVNGNVNVPVDLQPLAGANTYALLTWTFSGNQTCSQAGVANVVVTVDNGQPGQYPCAQGQGTQFAQTVELSAGPHDLSLQAVNAQNGVLDIARGQITTVSGGTPAYNFTMTRVGGLALQWNLASGSAAADCSSINVQAVTVTFRDSAQNVVLTDTDRRCGDGQNPYKILYNNLPEGTSFNVTVDIASTNGGGFRGTATLAAVNGNVFADVNTAPDVITLSRY